jgi:sugar phosphate isomerase/epimerase
MFKVGLNPYGINCSVGLIGQGTHQECLEPLGLNGFVDLVQEFGARSIEIHTPQLGCLDDEGFAQLRDRLASANIEPVISNGSPLQFMAEALEAAVKLGAKTVRVGLSPVLCGDRAAHGAEWPRMIANVRSTLTEFAPRAADRGLTLAIEDHQDFGSQELLDFAEEAGDNVGICFDTGNPLAVAEDPIAFAKRVAHRVRHVHLKDYNAQFTDEGYRLVRCAIGDGAVPFAQLAQILGEHHTSLTASLEPGALEVRHVRLFTQAWLQGYPDYTARELAACIAAARRNHLPEDLDWRTPWEQGLGASEICDYEMTMMRKSVANMRELGWL